MFKRLSLEQFLEAARTEKRIAVYLEIPSDRITPISVFEALGEEAKGAMLLESAVKEKERGRYSLLGFQPIASLYSTGHSVTVISEGKSKVIDADPFGVLREYFQKLRAKTLHPLSGFIGGTAGFVTYDAVRLFENIPDKNPDRLQLPDIYFKFYRHGIAFDNETNKAVITTLVEVNDNAKESYEQAIVVLEKIKNKILSTSTDRVTTLMPSIPAQKYTVSTENDEQDNTAYKAIIERAKHYITIGDIFQVVLSRPFYKKFTVKPFDIYRALRFKSPAPYMFYLDYEDYQIVGASPERLVSVHSGIVRSSPLAGTRPRGSSPEQDDALAKELLQNDKEIAEHMMLIDLTRNDVGAVSMPGKVLVKELLQVKKFSHVMHISSTIEGRLKDNLDAFDALRATFPAGTLSGAPKIRAMEIIDELEEARRGLYGGAICNMNANGDLESCIAIRMAVLKDQVATVQAGAGIVFDSEPDMEVAERRHKASTVLDAIAYAEERVI